MKPTTSTDPQLVSDIYAALRSLQYDVTNRNLYMNRRDRYVFADGLWETLEIHDGSDRTMYNFLHRVVDIHTAQLMGRPFQVYSNYLKDDLSLIDPDSQDAEERTKMSELSNKRKQADADLRKKFVDAIIRDNGGFQIFQEGARIGAIYGTTIYKMWWDNKAKKIRISLIESPQNYYAGWSDSDFRERDFDAYVWQISTASAVRNYAKSLPSNGEFKFSAYGNPFDTPLSTSNANTNDPINQHPNNPDIPVQTQRPMITCIDFTGYLEGWGLSGGKIVPVSPGKETKLSVLVVGGQVVQQINDEKLMPNYYIINNRVVPRRSWGESDLPDSALDINASYIERMSDYVTLVNKTIFPMYQMIGFDPASIPKKRQRQALAVSMTPEQRIEIVNQAQNLSLEYGRLLQELKDSFIHVTGISRMMFDDPTAASDSNQALMTTMKGLIDAVEDKQKRWEPSVIDMLTDALHLAANYVDEIDQVLNDDEDWYFKMEWPSVLRREDAVYQTTWLNLHNAGVISWETYLEKIGIENVTEEHARLRDEMKDPVAAAVLGKQLGEIAHQTLNKALGIPPWGYIIPKVNIKGEMTPQQEGNMAQNFGWGDGPFGNSIGPQGNQGDAANQNEINQGTVNGNPFDGGMPINTNAQGQPGPLVPQGQPGTPVSAMGGDQGGAPAPTQGPAPTMTPDNNMPGGAAPTSMPGSGATTSSAKGAVKKHNQNHGR